MQTTSRDAVSKTETYPRLYKDERGHYVAYDAPVHYMDGIILTAMCVETGVRYSIPKKESQSEALGFIRVSSITIVE